MEKDSNFIYEPVDEFLKFKETHNENVTEYFNSLVKNCEINEEENRASVSKLNASESISLDLKKKISKLRALNFFIYFIITALLVGVVVSIIAAVNNAVLWLHILLIVIEILISFFLIVIIVKKINPKIKKLIENKNDTDKLVKSLYDECYKQLESINKAFDFGIQQHLFTKTLPLIKLDKTFNSKRLEYLVEKFQHTDEVNLNSSTLFIQSGEMNGNPFYVTKQRNHKMGDKDYEGQLVIQWVTYYTDSSGRTHTRTHTQTLYATVTKPCPYYNENQYLIFANECAPNIKFSREPNHVEKMNKKQLERHIKKGIKTLDQLANTSLKNTNDFMPLGNKDFDVLFNATNRDNSIEFRILFTPLAQTQMQKILLDNSVGFGDNFFFEKDHKLNLVMPEHLVNFDLNVGPKYFNDYNIDNMRKKFIEYNNDYFKRMYFTFAPILAIPEYQQTKPHEYIYKDVYKSNLSYFEHEYNVNTMGEEKFNHEKCKTPSILKTVAVSTNKTTDTVDVTSYGYDAIERVEYVPVLGGDGNYHDVPVNWIEYIPLSKTTRIEINEVEKEENKTYRQIFEEKLSSLKDMTTADKDNLYVSAYMLSRIINDDCDKINNEQ